jgi:hypothetical protein
MLASPSPGSGFFPSPEGGMWLWYKEWTVLLEREDIDEGELRKKPADKARAGR